MKEIQILTLSQLYSRGIEIMGKERFLRWMDKKHIAIGGKRPVELLDSPDGMQQILDELGRIEHGILG